MISLNDYKFGINVKASCLLRLLKILKRYKKLDLDKGLTIDWAKGIAIKLNIEKFKKKLSRIKSLKASIRKIDFSNIRGEIIYCSTLLRFLC